MSTRTPSFTLSLRALLTFPVRLCNPPPAASTVRSCKVTPLVKVSLDDVLNKRHLPPLTLKDFEEWLVFVEGNPHYLYFILWLREYQARYATWLAQYGYNDAIPSAAHLNLLPASPALALFYTRAKQTFLDPFGDPPSPYALPPAALSPSSTHSFSSSIPHFTASLEATRRESLAHFSAHPHPHPKQLASVAHYARTALKESLERFAATACHNVGTRRAWCGIAGGSFLTLILGVLPTLLTIFYAPSRWWRVIGWLGCWIGGTVILSSLHGICMMIYLFGDLRQLRSFELARPSISQPKAIARARPRLLRLFTNTTDSSYDPDEPSTPSVPEDHPCSTTCAPTRISQISQTSTGTPIVNLALAGTALHTIAEPKARSTTSGSNTGMGTGTTNNKRTSIAIHPGNESTKLVLRASDPTLWQVAAQTVQRWTRTTMSLAGEKTGTHAEMRTRGSTYSHVQTVSNAGTFGIRSWMTGLMGGRRSEERRLQIEFDDECYVGAPLEDKRGEANSERASTPGGASMMPTEGEDPPTARPTSALTLASSGLEDHPIQSSFRLTMDFDVRAHAVSHQTTSASNADTPTILSFRSPSTDPDLPPLFYRTATFIKRDYPSDMLREIPPPRTSHDIIREELAHRPQPEPLRFDFDQLPVRVPLPTLDDVPPEVSLAAPLRILPKPLPTALPPFLPVPPPPPSARSKLWMDSCPRHPAVEANFVASVLASQHQLLAKDELDSPLPSPATSTFTDTAASTSLHSPAAAQKRRFLIGGGGSFLRSRPSANANAHAHTDISTVAGQRRNRDVTWRARFREVTAVPAFGPLTRVLEPVVARGQWEVVVRSAGYAAVGAWVFVGCLMALPVAGLGPGEGGGMMM